MIPQNIGDRIRNHGLNGASFQSLYSGYRYFSVDLEGELGVIAYVETPTAWIGACEPIASPERIGILMQKFKESAKKRLRAAAFLPVSAAVASEARKRGWCCVQIGSEPWYNLENAHTTQNARQFSKKGATLERFYPNLLSDREKLELDELTARWLESRKMAPLSFLNRVEPWQLFQERRYFRVIYRNQLVAYLAAVPVKARNAWYLVDLIREPDSPPGATELLIVESARHLRQEGAREVTLGMSPFVPPEGVELARHPGLYPIFNYIFNRTEALYGFKSLFQYKQKFAPDRWEPQFFISLESTIGVRTLLGLSRAIFPKGVLHTTFSTSFRLFGRFNINSIYRKILNDKIVPRTPPQDFLNYLTRCKVTIPVVLLSALYFFTSTDAHFHIRRQMVERYSYSFENFINGSSPTRGFIDVIIASFLHWDIVHLATNFSMILLFMSFLEVVCGSGITFTAYLSGILLTNPLTSLLMAPWFYFFSPDRLEPFLHEPDIGCSLGVFSCIGALSLLVKKRTLLLGFFAAVTLVYNLVIHSQLGYNHLVALAIGYLIGKRYVASK